MGLGTKPEPGLLVLISLLAGPLHGYAITQDIERMTGRRPGPGTLYGAIGRLEAAGLIEAQEGDARRKPYALTSAGIEAARAELDKMSALATEGTRRLKALPA
jgi:DNA-binding PadR family transcriptional regulator